MEELQQVLSDKGLSFSTLPDKGRCLFTTRDFFPGNAILSEEPYVSVPSKTSGCSRCDWCFTSSNLKRCSSCQAVWYCGSTCQKSDWKLHHLECQALTKLDKNRLNSVTPSIRLMVKLYLRRKLQSDKISIKLQDWREALIYCKLTIPVYQRVYPGYHPLLGLQYYACGKLEWLLGNTEEAIKSLTKAVDILRNTHGTSTPFMKDLLAKLEEAHAEASYKLSSIDINNP